MERKEYEEREDVKEGREKAKSKNRRYRVG